MSFKFHHSLASRAAVSVVSSLWYHEDIDSLKRYKKRTHRLVLHERVTESVAKLPIPEDLARYLLEFVQLIGENLEDWLKDHYREPTKITKVIKLQFFRARTFDRNTLAKKHDLYSRSRESRANASIDVDLRKVLRWTPDGEIDLEQTGEALVQNESDSIKRFRLACAYCKENEILRLWPSIQGHFSSPNAWDSTWVYLGSGMFWRRYFNEFWPEPVSTYLLDYRGVESFTAALRSSLAFNFTNNCSPLTMYLLRKKQMTHSRIIERIMEQDLKTLLRWSRGNLFIETVERSWNMFDGDLFDSVLLQIVSGIVDGCEDGDFCRRIFRRYWTGSPARLRDVERLLYDREVVGGRTLRYFVGVLFGHSPTAEDKMKRILFEGRHVLELATHVRSRDVLARLVCTCLPPEEWDAKLDLLGEHFAGNPDSTHKHQ